MKSANDYGGILDVLPPNGAQNEELVEVIELVKARFLHVDYFFVHIYIYNYYKFKSRGLGQAKPEPSREWRLWPGLRFDKAEAGLGQAKAAAFRPSRAVL